MDKKVTFPAGDLILEGRVWLATGSRDVGVVLCHPHPLHGGNMYSNVVSAVAEALWHHDVSTLRFNFRGTGASTGSHGGGDTEGADVAAAVAYLLNCQPSARLAVAGYSFGAGVGLLAGTADARVTALVGIAPPVARRDMSLLHTCTKAKLFVTGDKDHVCPLPVLQDLLARCPEPKALALIPGADHFFLGYEAEVAEAVVTFVTRLYGNQEKTSMQDLPISYFPIAERQHCSETLQKLFAELEATLGFVPNVIRAFAWREPRFWKWWAHRNDLMAPSAGLSKAEREMVAVVVSAANDCLYCMTSHGYAVRVLLGDPVTAERILLDYHRAGLDARTLAMLDYAVKITQRPAACGLEDVECLRQHGFRDEDIWDIAEIAAMYNYTNRLASAAGWLPNPEYHGLAR